MLLAVAGSANPLEIFVTPAAVIGIAALNVVKLAIDAAVKAAQVAGSLVAVIDQSSNITRIIPE
jgi:hypothetical protein